ncbi:MAG: hypothetical protein JOS17DRAFT_838316 [Linnemannia elongata]|nr:MAG: hypothetical protein JOS17DRAFT_838316 [Linnemannia elongata]
MTGQNNQAEADIGEESTCSIGSRSILSTKATWRKSVESTAGMRTLVLMSVDLERMTCHHLDLLNIILPYYPRSQLALSSDRLTLFPTNIPAAADDGREPRPDLTTSRVGAPFSITTSQGARKKAGAAFTTADPRRLLIFILDQALRRMLHQDATLLKDEQLKNQLIVDRGILNSKYMESKGLPSEAYMWDKVLEILSKL